MYSMVLMAALTTGTDMPDLGRRGGRGGGCCGCYGGMAYGGGYGGGWGGGCCGCYGGMAYGGGYGGGCYGMGMGYGGWGGCGGMGMGYGGWGGCYGGMAYGGWGGGWGGYGRGGYGLGGYGLGGYVLGGTSPLIGGYASAPMMSTYGTPLVLGNTLPNNAGTTQSFFFTPNNANQGNEATIIVHLPADATLTIDGQPTQSTSGTRTFVSPPLQAGKTYTYTLRAERNRDGRIQNVKRNVDVRAGQPSEVTLNFDNVDRDDQ